MLALERAGLDEALSWGTLDGRHVEAVCALHHVAVGTLDSADWVRRETPDFFADILDGNGLGLGVFHEERLIAYALIQTRLEPEDDLCALLGYAAARPTAKLCGSAVDPDYRGRGLQQALSRERLAFGRRTGIERFFATAAPQNCPSWMSLMRAGLMIAALGERYGGRLRYTLVLDEVRSDQAGGCREVDASDVAGQADLLRAGWRGIRYRRSGESVLLEFMAC
ncbi:GNAT family N-acetyltransferase [Microvirga sp. TS319]|uniref:GNAT family N-acetyltransferase n=1 Tax=Microvirga sp. TS319 TaxID=3241165 RepID=UPI00351A2861